MKKLLLLIIPIIDLVRSHLVNKKYIKSWKKEYGDFLLLFNRAEIPVSRTKKEYVKKALDSC